MRIRHVRCGVMLGVVLVLGSRTLGQSFNVALGPPTDQPSDSYAAAGLPGYWNALPGANGSFTYNLRDINGNTTGVRLYQYGGTALMYVDDGGTEGDDDLLMDRFLITYTPTLETCLFLDFLSPGDYEAIIYAWMPGDPHVQSYTNSDEEFGNPHRIVGGEWTGQHEQGVTYSIHTCMVLASGTQRLRLHSGIVPGADPARGAACNGVQIRKLPPRVPGDLNCDGVKNGRDVADFVRAITNPPAYREANPLCSINNADMNNDHVFNQTDVAQFVASLLAP